jgi:hypothetical protein
MTGKDDNKYVALMDKYKQTRRNDSEGSVKYLEAAMKLRESGDVSDDAVIGGAYL